MSEDEILTIREVAALLKIGEKTAYTMAQGGQLPGFKVRGQWRFRRADIEAWISQQLGGSRVPALNRTAPSRSSEQPDESGGEQKE
jgi:excisionase family DNA binding protein